MTAAHQVAQADGVWRGWAWIISILVIIAAVVVWRTLIRMQESRVRRRFELEISNLGNAESRYDLLATEPSNELDIAFILQNVRLPAHGVVAPLAQPGSRRPPQAPSASSPPEAKKSSGGAKATAKQAMGIGGALAGLLSTLGSLLPRSIGSPLTRTAMKMRQGESTARRVERLPGQAARLKPKSSGAEKPPAAPRPGATTPYAAPTPDLAASQAERWSRTPVVKPGETLTVELIITPLDPYTSQTYPFSITSRSVEQPDAKVTQDGSIDYQGLTPLQRYGPFLIVTFTGIVIITATFLLIGSAGS